MAPKFMLLAAALCAMALSGCTAGDDGGDGSSDDTTTAGGGGVGGNVTVGNSTVSGSFTATGTNGTGNATGGGDAPMSETVSLEDGQFVNQTVTIRSGGMVTWTHNDGNAPHTVTADDESFDSHPGCDSTLPLVPPMGDCMTQGETFSHTFDAPGTYSYHSKVDPAMTGTVTVVDGS